MAAWQIGIDEAGYGPVLGPFVMTAVALKSQSPFRPEQPWRLLHNAPASPGPLRFQQKSEEQFCIADSKEIHRGSTALARLEYHTLPILWPWLGKSLRFMTLLNQVSVCKTAGLHLPCYYPGRLKLPLCHPANILAQRAAKWAEILSRSGLTLVRPRVFVLLPQSINDAITRHGTKGVLPAEGLAHLLPAVLREIEKTEPFATPVEAFEQETEAPMHWEVYCDRLGGRLYYAELLADILDDWHLQAYRETRQRCEYTLESNAARDSAQPVRPSLRVVITPRAEHQAFVVALASMISKYIREVFMFRWNAYWQQHVPGLRPTAGYPSDAPRFLHQIETARMRLGLAESLLRRCR